MAASGMAFKLTFSDGQETDYDDNTKWEVENGVVKMGRESGKWTVFISPSHWATLELASGKDQDKSEKDRGRDDKDQAADKDKDKDSDTDTDKGKGKGKGKGKDKDD